jgi:hypothetical protein
MTLMADTASTPNAMDILRDATVLDARKVVADDMVNLRYINATSEDIGGDEDKELLALEPAHSILTLELRAVTMHEDGGNLAVVKVVVEFLYSGLAVAEDESTTSRLVHEQVVKSLLLLVAFDKDDVLGDILVSRTSTTDADADGVFGHVHAGDLASLLGEGSREHEVSVVGVFVDV